MQAEDATRSLFELDGNYPLPARRLRPKATVLTI